MSKTFFKPEDFYGTVENPFKAALPFPEQMSDRANRLVEPLLQENELLRLRVRFLEEVLEEEKESFNLSWGQP